MKKLCFVLIFTLLIGIFPAGAVNVVSNENDAKNVVVNVTPEKMYYDPELDANVMSYTVDDNGSVTYLTKAEVDALSANQIQEADSYFESASSPPIVPWVDYIQWYVFKQKFGPYHYQGSTIKVSRDLIAPAGGGSISVSINNTIEEFFSAGITSAAQKSAIQAGVNFSWTKSASITETHTINLLPGQSGYVGFAPYYNQVIGDLDTYANQGVGYIGTTRNVYGYSVKTTGLGEADGVFKFIEY